MTIPPKNKYNTKIFEIADKKNPVTFGYGILYDTLSAVGQHKKRPMVATKKQMAIPIRVGKKNAKAVHFQLPVSLCMVRQVVAQGRCV